MAELDKIPQKQTVELATVKLDEAVYENIQQLNGIINQYIIRFGEIYLRKKELSEELIKMDDALEQFENEFKSTNEQLREIINGLDEQYPQGRLNLQEGTITYQPGAPSRKQMQQPQQQQSGANQMKVVKE
jgi:uncharacterized membrane-anchored protein YhcB (DUF1043 family)